MHDVPVSSLSRARRLLRDVRGATSTEYLVTVGVVGLVIAAGLVARGDMMLLDYVNARDLFLVPAL